MTRIAPCSKDIKHFFNDGSVPAASGHATQYFLDSKNAQTSWVLKRFEKGDLAQIEAGMAALYYAMAKPNTIPKVYAVYHKTAEAPSEIFASISSVFPEFHNLKTYLLTGLDEEKLSFLIEKGFPEICVLSYFFEEDDLHKGNIGISHGNVVRIDFDMSAFSIVGKQELRGSRSSLDSRRLIEAFNITSKDIEHFPELSDAMPFYFPGVFRAMSSSNGYSADEVRKFSALQRDSRFVKRAYLMLLKMVSMPDEMFSIVLSAHIGNPEIVSELSAHLILRKQILRAVLLQKNECQKFKNFLETLSTEEINSIFFEINQHNLKNTAKFQQIDLKAVQSNFHHFIYDSMKAGDLYRFLDVTAHLAEKFTVDPVEVLKKARETLLYHYQWLTEKKLLSLEDIVLFVKEMKSNLAMIKTLFVPADEQVDALYTNINVRLDRLERYGHAVGLFEMMRVSPTEEFDMIDFPVRYVEQLNQGKLVIDAIRWLQQEDKKQVIVTIIQHVLMEVKIQRETWIAKISSAVASVAAGASSFFRAPAVTVSVVESQLQKLLDDFSSDSQVLRFIFQVLSLTGDDADQLKDKIIFKFIAEFVSEFSAKTTIDQLQIDPVLSGFLRMQPFFLYPSMGASELIVLFKNEVQPYVACFIKPTLNSSAVIASQV